jgi:hypothetical protein
MKYFVTIMELATELSNYFGKKNAHVRQTLNKESARIASKMLVQLISGLTE